MGAIVVVIAMKLVFVTDVHENASSAVIRFDDAREGHVARGDAHYAEILTYARRSQQHHYPVAVTLAKPDRIVTIEPADSDTVQYVKESTADKLEVGFAGHAAKYFLRRDNPDFRRVSALLERSAKDRSLVWLSFQQREKIIVDALLVEQKRSDGAHASGSKTMYAPGQNGEK